MIKKIILDTDLGSDVDDVGALALANLFHNKKIIDLLCVTHTTSGQYGPLVCEAINEYYNNPNIPVGAYNGPIFLQEELPNNYVEPTFKAWPHKHNNSAELTDSVKLMRKTLANNDNVTMVFIGQLLNLYYLMKSKKDEYSSFDGEELINSKVKEIYIMGGSFPELFNINIDKRSEYNLMTAPEASKYVFPRLKVKTILVDGTIGNNVVTGAKLVKKMGDKNITSYAYSRYIYKNDDCSRNSWDLITIYRASIRDDLFKESPSGIVTLDEDCITSFLKDKNGNFTVLLPNKPYEKIQEEIDSWLCEEK